MFEKLSQVAVRIQIISDNLTAADRAAKASDWVQVGCCLGSAFGMLLDIAEIVKGQDNGDTPNK